MSDKICWFLTSKTMPKEETKVYIKGENFVCQAYYHIGMYWQDANRSTQRYPLGAVTQWAEILEEVAISKTPEQMAEEYVKTILAVGGKDSIKIDFLAGYQAAKDQLADADKVMRSSNNSNNSSENGKE